MKKQQPEKPAAKKRGRPQKDQDTIVAPLPTAPKAQKKPAKKKASTKFTTKRVSQKPAACEAQVTQKRRTTGEWIPLFLANLSENGNVRLACQSAGIERPKAYDRRDADEVFRKAWDDAMEHACDILAEEARRRALSISDVLLIFLLKAHRPAVYRETYRHEHTGKDGSAIEGKVRIITEIPAQSPSAEAWSDRAQKELPE